MCKKKGSLCQGHSFPACFTAEIVRPGCVGLAEEAGGTLVSEGKRCQILDGLVSRGGAQRKKKHFIHKLSR